MNPQLSITLGVIAGLLAACSNSQPEASSPDNAASTTGSSQAPQPEPTRSPEKATASSQRLTAPKTSPQVPSLSPRQEIYPASQFLSPLTQRVRANLKRLSEASLHLHDDRFVKVGGSGSSTPLLLSCLDRGPIELGDWEHLKPSLTRFRRQLPDGSSTFSRKSLAAKPGGTARWVLDGAPSPLEQEIQAVQPRFALVHYGTNDMLQKGTFESAAKAFNQDM